MLLLFVVTSYFGFRFAGARSWFLHSIDIFFVGRHFSQALLNPLSCLHMSKKSLFVLRDAPRNHIRAGLETLSYEDWNFIGTRENMGLLDPNVEMYFKTNDGLKYQLPDGEVKMCITKGDAVDWVRRVHKYQVPHLCAEETTTQVHKGPYWWHTISLDVKRLVNKCRICQLGTMLSFRTAKYGTIPFRRG